jgi:Zn-dependent M16 (insulinase) family peptidase
LHQGFWEIEYSGGYCAGICCCQVRGKAMGHNSGDLFELMGDILATARLDDKARFTQMVAETKAGMESGIIGSGHR